MQPYEDTPEEYLEAIRNKNVRQYAVKTIKSGEFLESILYPVWLKVRDIPKGPKYNPSSEAQEKLNDKNAQRCLTRLIHCNFTVGVDWVGTLTSDDDHLFKNLDDARKAATNAINRFKYAYAKKGIDFKYIYAVEYKNARNRFKRPIIIDGVQMIRMHIHMIIPAGLTISELRKPWKLGNTMLFEPLRDYKEGQTGLAVYLAKDPKDGHRRWASSRNLKQPTKTVAYRKKFASKRKVQAIAANENLRPSFFEKIYEDYEFLESEALYNDVNDGTYLYIKMRKKPPKKGKTNGKEKNQDGRLC